MKFNMIVKKSEINEIKTILETINNIIPEELGFEMPSSEDLRLENGRYFDEEKYGYLLIEEDHGDYEITMNLNEEFTVDTVNLLNKITLAAAPIVGAIVGFTGTMKVLGGKFIKKLTDLGEKFSEKWFISPESAPASVPAESKTPIEEGKYGVYPLIFSWSGEDGIEQWERAAVVVGRKDDDSYSILKLRCKVPYVNSQWESAYRKAGEELLSEIREQGFEGNYVSLTDAMVEMLKMYEDMQPEKPERKIETPIEDVFKSIDGIENAINDHAFKSLEDLEKTIRENKRNESEELPNYSGEK